MKLISIITEQGDSKFTTVKTSENPETNSTTWDVRPTPLRAAVEDIENLSRSLTKAAEAYPEDPKLTQYKVIIGKIKKVLKTHISKTYGT